MTLRIKVIPRSRKNEISGELADGTIKVPVRAVQIVTGHGNPRKVVRIDLKE